jgi:hypothetical protein
MRDFRPDIVGRLLFTFGRRIALGFRAGAPTRCRFGNGQARNFARYGQLLGTDLSRKCQPCPILKCQRGGIYGSLAKGPSISVSIQLQRGLGSWHGGIVGGARVHSAARLHFLVSSARFRLRRKLRACNGNPSTPDDSATRSVNLDHVHRRQKQRGVGPAFQRSGEGGPPTALYSPPYRLALVKSE